MKHKITILFFIMGVLFSEKKVGLIPISGEINSALYTKVKFSLDYFEKQKFNLVIVAVDTPGGEVFNAIKIANMLQNSPVQVVACIDSWAISAGALITYSCPKVYAKKGAIMGAAAPVQPTVGGQMVEASEKINSALRAQFRVTAKAANRNVALAQAMVDKDLCVVQREGKIILLDDNEFVKPSDKVICSKGKLLTLSSDELLEYAVVDDLVGGDLLDHPDFSDFKGVKPIEYKNKKLVFFSILQNPFVSSILSIAMMAGLYSFFSSGVMGFNFFCALMSGALILLTQFSSQTFAFLEWILLGIGLACLLIESFIPGFGVIGCFGVLFTICGLFCMNVAPIVVWNLPNFGFSGKVLSERIVAFSVAISAFVIALLVFAKPIVSKLFKTSPLVLRDIDEPEAESEALFEGSQGVCVSALKPWGKIDVCGRVYQVKSEAGYIAEGKEVKITSINKSTFLVQEV